MQAYNEAFRKEYGSVAKGSPIHIRHIALDGDRNNNKMERLNGEFRDREKVIRGVKKMESPTLTVHKSIITMSDHTWV